MKIYFFKCYFSFICLGLSIENRMHMSGSTFGGKS